MHGKVFIPEVSDRERLDSAFLNRSVGRNPADASERAIQNFERAFDIFPSHLFIYTMRTGASAVT